MDRVVLDMLAPWDCLDAVSAALVPGGVLICYVATATQLSKTAEAMREQGTFTEPSAWESLVRGWHLEGLAVRPEHRMVGHTGFLLTTRRLADGVEPPLRRRRPAKGTQGEPESQAGAAGLTRGEPVGRPNRPGESGLRRHAPFNVVLEVRSGPAEGRVANVRLPHRECPQGR